MNRFILLTCLAATLVTFVVPQEFDIIRSRCFNMTGNVFSTLGAQNGPPLGMTMENLISLIEKIERTRKSITPENLARILLHRFQFDGMLINYVDKKPDPTPMRAHAKYMKEIFDKMLNTYDVEGFPEEALTENEKCSLFFMITHNTNYNAKPSDKNVRQYMSPSVQSTTAAGKNGYRSKTNLFAPTWKDGDRIIQSPREEGVATFRNNPEHAIAVGRVLLGIIVGYNQPSGVRLQDIAGEIFRFTGKMDTWGELPPIDPLFAVTFGDLISYSYVTKDNVDSSKPTMRFQGRGAWNSSLCPVEYRLSENYEYVITLAQMRGALDGFILGKRLQQVVTSPGNKLKLSNILRMYYAKEGFGNVASDMSYCHRGDSWPSEITQVMQQQKSVFGRIGDLLACTECSSSEADINNFLNTDAQKFVQGLNLAKEIPNDDKDGVCDVQTLPNEEYICETPTNAFVLVNTADADHYRDQLEITTNVTVRLHLASNRDGMTIVTNSKSREDRGRLMSVVYRSNNTGCATCGLTYFASPGSGDVRDLSELLDLINGTITRYEEQDLKEPGVPSKPFIIYNYGQFLNRPSGDTSKFRKSQYDLTYFHRDVPLIMVGGVDNAEELKLLARDDNTDVFARNPDDQDLPKAIVDRICQVPATFQHNECLTRKSDGGSKDKYEGYVTPGHIQYWAMYPEYFERSYTINMRFRADKGQVKICYARNTKPEEPGRGRCYETSRETPEIHIRERNPCNKYTRVSCAPFYFSIIGKEETTAAGVCNDEKCWNTKQVKFTFTHDGIQCSGSSRVALPTLLMTAMFVAIIYFNELKLKF